MLRDFQKDLASARAAELLVLEKLRELAPDWELHDVASEREFRYKGDIFAVSKKDKRALFIEVKDDSRIAETGNILCEEESYIKDDDRYIKGCMYCDTDIYCIVSQQSRKIYFIEFKTLKENYRKGEFKVIKHSDQDTYCYLLPLGAVKRKGGLLAEIEY